MATIIHSPIEEAQFVPLEARLSVEQWAAMPETKPHYELIEGELKRKLPTKRMHARTAFRLSLQLALWGDQHGWDFHTEGMGLRADNYNGFVPNVIGFAPDTAPDGEVVYTPSAFLVAEILSPATAANDRDAKKKGYARAEVELYLIVDAKQKRVEVYRLNGDIYGEPEVLQNEAMWSPPELAGLQLELAKLWM